MTEKLEKLIGYAFRDPAYLKEALTHSSYVNEHRAEELRHNERMEFLGDAVLELVSSRYLYEHYPEEPEGKLSRHRAAIVCEPSLAACARSFGLGSFLYMGRGEEKNGGRERDSILSDAFEALIGAIFLDAGYEEARRFVERFVMRRMSEHPVYADAKTRLQELAQVHGETEIAYELTGETGPEHDKSFTVELRIDGKLRGKGTGRSKKAAEQAAAAMALKEWKDVSEENRNTGL